MRYLSIFIPKLEGGYTVTFPDIPEIVTEGKNLDMAMDMAEKILKDTLNDYTREGLDFPKRSTLEDVDKIAKKKMLERGVDTTRIPLIQLVTVFAKAKSKRPMSSLVKFA